MDHLKPRLVCLAIYNCEGFAGKARLVVARQSSVCWFGLTSPTWSTNNFNESLLTTKHLEVRGGALDYTVSVPGEGGREGGIRGYKGYCRAHAASIKITTKKLNRNWYYSKQNCRNYLLVKFAEKKQDNKTVEMARSIIANKAMS